MTPCCAIIVTWKPDGDALLRLLTQIDREADFLVLDNGSPNIASLAAAIRGLDHCLELRCLPDNLGLAAALNMGIAAARAAGYPFITLFDQDSQLGESCISRLLEAHAVATTVSARPVAAVGPRLVEPHSGRRTAFKRFDRWWGRTDSPLPAPLPLFVTDFLITSGTLLDSACLETIGEMRSDYFIDNVDLEWCFRARARGYALVGTDHAELYHRIGESSEHPLVRAGWMVMHSPTRAYYSSRNRVHLYGQSYAPRGWKWRDLPRFLLKSAWLLLTSPRRTEYWRNIRSGIRDAARLEQA